MTKLRDLTWPRSSWRSTTVVLASDAKVYKSEQVEAWWDVPVYADHQEVRANQVDARVVNHVSKKVMTIEKYGPLRWELKEKINIKDTRCTSITSSWMCLVGGWKRQRLVCNHWLGERLLMSQRECRRPFYWRRSILQELSK